MKVSELMIGDWVQGNPCGQHCDRNNNTYYKIATLDIVDHCWGYSSCGALVELKYDDIFPIPLTPEILEKNGYKRIKGGRVMGLHVADIFDLEISNEYGRYLKIDLQDFGETESTHWYIGIQGKFSFSGYIGYVNQLQHIYRLCGVEKDIEL